MVEGQAILCVVQLAISYDVGVAHIANCEPAEQRMAVAVAGGWVSRSRRQKVLFGFKFLNDR